MGICGRVSTHSACARAVQPRVQPSSSSPRRRAIRLSFGPIDDMTAANSTTAQPAERIRWAPTSTLAPTEAGTTVMKSWPSAVKNEKDRDPHDAQVVGELAVHLKARPKPGDRGAPKEKCCRRQHQQREGHERDHVPYRRASIPQPQREQDNQEDGHRDRTQEQQPRRPGVAPSLAAVAEKADEHRRPGDQHEGEGHRGKCHPDTLRKGLRYQDGGTEPQ